MTKRQLEVLRMVRASIEKKEQWIELALSKGAESLITFEEMQWVAEFEKQAMLTRIEAALLLEDEMARMRMVLALQAEQARVPGFSNEGDDIDVHKIPAAVCTPSGCCQRD